MILPSFHFTALNTLHILTTVYFPSLHFTSLHCIFDDSPPHLHFALFITFLTLFLKLLDLQDRIHNCYESCETYEYTLQQKKPVKPVLNGISRDQNIFPLKPGFRLIKVYYNNIISEGT
jgi:hypothetical protein